MSTNCQQITYGTIGSIIHRFKSNFQKYLETKKLSPASIKNYVSDLRKFLTWHAEKQEAEGQPLPFTTELLKKYQLELVKQKTPDPTINRHLSSLRSFLLGHWFLLRAFSHTQFDHHIKIVEVQDEVFGSCVLLK